MTHDRSMRGKTRYIWLLPMIIWVILIIVLSSQPYEQQTIIPILARVIGPVQLSEKLPDVEFHYGDRWIHAKKQPYVFVEFMFRKTAHFTVYMMLAFLAMAAFHPFGMRIGQRVTLVLLICTAFSMIDETIQLFSQSRTSQLNDVLIDLTGAAVGVGLAWLFLRYREVTRSS